MSKKILLVVVKYVIFIATIFFIYKKISELKISDFSGNIDYGYAFVVILLLVPNLFAEALKFYFLIRKYNTSFFAALKSTLTGNAFAFVTPNRLGDFAGRPYFLRKIPQKAFSATLICSLAQSVVTFIAGLWGLTYFFSVGYAYYYVISALSLAVVFTYLNLFKILPWLAETFRLKQKAERITDKQGLFNLLIISILRYSIFMFQYYFSFKTFSVDINLFEAIIIISCVFFVSTYLPKDIITDLGIKNSAAIYFASAYTSNTTSIMASVILIWFINTLIPAMLGLYVLVRFKT